MDKKLTLEDKYNLIKEKLGETSIIYFEDIQHLFPEKKKSTLYWDVSKLVDESYLFRERNGVYKLNYKKVELHLNISEAAKKAMNILDETGFNYYVSGIDILTKYLHHIPETYPILVFVEKNSTEEFYKVLTEKSYYVINSAKSLNSPEAMNFINHKDIVILVQTESFTNYKNHYATIEKAFLDLFYEITRNEYPLALQELVRVYQNMKRNGAIDQKKLVKIAYDRKMQYDIRFIVESKYISESAISFVESLKRMD